MDLGWDSQLQFLWVEKCKCWIQVLLLLLWDLPLLFLVFDLHTCYEPLHVVLRRLVHLSHDEKVLLAQRGGVEAQVCREVRLHRLCTRALHGARQYHVVVASSRDTSLTLVYSSKITVHDSTCNHCQVQVCMRLSSFQNAFEPCKLASFSPKKSS